MPGTPTASTSQFLAKKSSASLYKLATNAGFSPAQATIAAGIAIAESGGNAGATHKNTNGSTDYGLWQINSIHSDILRMGDWKDPQTNARMAYAVFKQAGGKFTPWATYNSGAYLKTPDKQGVTGEQHATEGFVNPISSVTDFLAALASGSLWTRIGIGALGLFVLVIGLILLLSPKVSGTVGKLPIPV